MTNVEPFQGQEKLKIALVHYFLVNKRGGEKVFYTLAELFPGADTYALVVDKKIQPHRVLSRLKATSFVQHLPFSISHFRHYFFLYPFAVQKFNLSNYDLVISSSAGWAHGVRVGVNTLHVCYCHTPLRYVWHWYDDFIRSISYWQRPWIIPILKWIRNWDFHAAQRVDYFIANSTTTKRRISQFYKKDSHIIYPPVDISDSSIGLLEDREDFFLVVSHLVPYKRVDIAIKAFNALGLPLKIVGDGPMRPHLEKIAKGNIEFLGYVTRTDLCQLYRRCKALIYTAEEDFGIVPVEAQATGCPVIAYGAGGVLDTVIDGLTGKLFYSQLPESLIEAISSFNPHDFDPYQIQRHALRFSEDNFKTNILNFLKQVICKGEDR